MQTTVTLHIADSRDMSTLADGSVHLVVTSPPYPMIKMWDEMFAELSPQAGSALREALDADGAAESRAHADRAFDLMHEGLARTWAEAYRVLVPGGIACVNIGDATRTIGGLFRLFGNHSRVIEHCGQIGFVSLPCVLWKKPTNRPNAFLGSGFLPTSGYVTLDVEYVLIFRKGGPRVFPVRDEARYASRFTKEERDVWFSQVWDVRAARQKREDVARRTAAFPQEIPRRLIRMFSVRGDTVLDPFAGTGTTLAVACELGRNAVGYERDGTLLAAIEGQLDEKGGRGMFSVLR